MRITLVTPYVMQAGAPTETSWSAQGMSAAGSRNWCFVRIDTDEGVHGVGEGSGWPLVVGAAIADLAPLLIGEDARNIDQLWHRMFVAQMGHGQTGVVGAGAIGAIDMALWDLNAKALGVPVWRMLGGRFRDRIRAYVHASSLETARGAINAGFTALKTGNVTDAAAKIALFRRELGDEIDLAVDLHGPPWLTAADAIATIRQLEPHQPMFVEEPVPPEDLDGLKRVRAATDLPIAAGERLALLWGYRALIEQGLVDIIQPDTGRVGGISQLRKIAALAEAHFVQVAPHSGTLGPVAEYAAIHFLASIPNALIHERFLTDWPGRDRVVSHPIDVVDGHVIVPDRPGLGVDLILEEVARHPPGHNVQAGGERYLAAYAAGTADERVYFQARRARASQFKSIEGEAREG
ncbi:mandelate racemase/muconate lactonizing enzyme family protein [Sphingomonas sp. SFZ2018-12]|uniref:mandelate racemase/muconate lactonizing enzyme family protein n=1 Tax=Sphingomonas sp. SFZ2018-12 TaxID=2683197 RepID=UPI001F0E5E24|nr:mandelate racemase/muconate lactonizing enzyme family protein [Sphingomonas sp. SFZ2018-12]MCH4895044.1 mandelate racemase/muconate lactonizing enzyme family protein [Sphingomonas sp. SFZ2018-12]